jgi:cell wall-associated NlpC family hydrolase
MDWFNSYRLVKDGDGYIVEIYLNKDSEEFSQEFLQNAKENILQFDEKVRRFTEEKFKGIKISSIKLILGSVLVATIPFSAAATVSAADTVPVSTQQVTAQSVETSIMNMTGVVTATKLNMRSGPSTSYSIIHVLWQGNKVKVIGESGDWYKIQLSDGRTGWVSRSYLNIDVPQKINTVISTAKSLIGTPYVWGGESLQEGGFDCSGFTQYVFKQAGYQLNRISADQAKQGIPVSRSDLQPGDLVFYSFNMDGVISHVGIYIGNGQMVHSPKTGDTVKATSITTTYWESRFVTARRIIY